MASCALLQTVAAPKRANGAAFTSTGCRTWGTGKWSLGRSDYISKFLH